RRAYAERNICLPAWPGRVTRGALQSRCKGNGPISRV
ncbi:uncharacterized protein METZ01_LOCUS237690, partial [marine metagenome]